MIGSTTQTFSLKLLPVHLVAPGRSNRLFLSKLHAVFIFDRFPPTSHGAETRLGFTRLDLDEAITRQQHAAGVARVWRKDHVVSLASLVNSPRLLAGKTAKNAQICGSLRSPRKGKTLNVYFRTFRAHGSLIVYTNWCLKHKLFCFNSDTHGDGYLCLSK